MPLFALGDRRPQLDPDCWIAPDATLIGDVRVARGASVWFQTVIRADNDTIIIGPEVNVQDRCVLHVDPGVPLTLEAGVTVGHGAVLHGCTVGAGALIGINAVVLNRARVGPGCLVGACSLVTEGTAIPEGSLAVGSPARVVRPLTEAQRQHAADSARRYEAHRRRYEAELRRGEP